MKNIEPLQEVLDCLSNDMNINTAHFLAEYNTFGSCFKSTVNGLLSHMLIDSLKSTKLDGKVHFYEKGNAKQNE
jgi:hypothetical protein